MASVDEAAAAIRAGGLAIVPTDTVYGLVSSPHSEAAVRSLYEAKGREEPQPTALVAASIEVLLECIPELQGSLARIVRALLPGPYTLVLPNPAGRFRWLAGARPETLGVRVPILSGTAAGVLARVGALAATSANLPGGPDPRTLEEIPEELRSRVDTILDGGELPGTPSTVLDFTGPVPVVLREGAAPSAAALRIVGSVL